MNSCGDIENGDFHFTISQGTKTPHPKRDTSISVKNHHITRAGKHKKYFTEINRI